MRLLSLRGAGWEADTPDIIVGTGLYQHTVPSGEEKFPEGAVLAEFTPVTAEYNGVFESIPYLLVKALYFASQSLDLFGVITF